MVFYYHVILRDKPPKLFKLLKMFIHFFDLNIMQEWKKKYIW